MLAAFRNSRSAVSAWPCHNTSRRHYAEYSERPVPKSQRKPLVHSILFDPVSVREVKEYRFAKEWHIYKRRFEVPLMNAYRKFLKESEEERIAEKKQKRKDRRDETADIRRRHHMLQKKKHALLREAMIIRPWEKQIENMEDTFNWSMLKNPFTGQTDENSKYDLHSHFTPSSLLPVESWLFYNRTNWSQIPFLSNIYNPPEDSLAGLMRMAEQDQHDVDSEEDESVQEAGTLEEDRDEIGLRNADGELKEHMILEPETAKMALEHVDQFSVLRDVRTGPENWIPRVDHGYTLESECPMPLPEPEVEATDTDIGEEDFLSDESDQDFTTPGGRLAHELMQPRNEKLDTEDMLILNPLTEAGERQAIYDCIQILVNMPDRGQVQRWKRSVSPRNLELILKGAQRAGLSAPDFNFLKSFLQNRRHESNEQLERFRDIISPGFRERLLAALDIEEDVGQEGKVRTFNADGTSQIVSDEALAAENDDDEAPIKQEKKQDIFHSEIRDLLSEPESDALLDDSEIEEFDLAESPVDITKEDEEELEFDQADSVQSADYFIDYAFRIKKVLNFQMREQLMEYGLIGGQDDQYLLADPPALHVDLDPCVEIVHVSHIQSLTRYQRLEHVQRKVIFKVKMAYLNFPPEVLERFAEIVGPRYNPETGVFRYISKAQHNKHQNTIHGIRQIRKLFEAAFEASPYYLPVNQGEIPPEETVADCPTELRVYEMYEEPYVRPKPWLPESKRLKPRDPYFVFRHFPFGWGNKQVSSTEN